MSGLRISSLALAAGVSLGAANTALAQNSLPPLNQVWGAFMQTCGAVLRDPASALANPVIPPGTSSSLVQQTPGIGALYFEASFPGDFLTVDYTIVPTAGQTYVSCGSYHFRTEQYDVDAQAAAAKSMIEAGGMTTTGGRRQILQATGHFQDAQYTAVTGHALMIEGALGDIDHPIMLDIDPFGLSLMVTFVVEGP